MSEEFKRIAEIVDKKIRPMLQADGGDLELISYEDKTLRVRYKGACCGCPHAATGTLMAIETILREDFDPDITVEPA